MIQTLEVAVTYDADGVQKSFPYPYDYRNSQDIVGYLVDEQGFETEIKTNYKYDTVNNAYIYPLQGDPIRAPIKIKLMRETPLQNNVDLPDKLPFSMIEKEMDWIIMMLQETVYRANLSSIDVQIATQQANLATQQANKAKQEADRAENEKELAKAEAEKATNQADIATSNANNAMEKANLAGTYASQAFAATAPAWEETKTYSYPEVVAYKDGNSYRCIGESVKNENPALSSNWVKITLDGENFFEIDEYGNIMPGISPVYSSAWELDINGDIMPKEVGA